MLSLNQLKQLFNDKQLNHNQLSSGTFLFDRVPEFGASNEITYPLMGVTVNPVTIDGNIHTSNFLFSFLDLVHQDNRNMDEVMSDMQQAALDIFAQLWNDLQVYYNCTLNEGFTLDPVQSAYDDDVSGWSFQIGIVQHYDRSTCALPDSGNHAGLVTIYNSNGTVNGYLNPNGSYTISSSMVSIITTPYPTATGTTFACTDSTNIIGVFFNTARLNLTNDYTVSGNNIVLNTAASNDYITIVEVA